MSTQHLVEDGVYTTIRAILTQSLPKISNAEKRQLIQLIEASGLLQCSTCNKDLAASYKKCVDCAHLHCSMHPTSGVRLCDDCAIACKDCQAILCKCYYDMLDDVEKGYCGGCIRFHRRDDY